MSRPFSTRKSVPLLTACALLPAAARADDARPLPAAAAPASPGLWAEGGYKHPLLEAKAAPSRKETADALGNQISLFKELRAWRDTMRGQGDMARREFAPLKLGETPIKLAVGKQLMPATLGQWNGAQQAPGAEIRAGMFSFGTTRAPGAMDKLLQGFDRIVEDNPTSIKDENSLTWMAARPVENQNGTLEFAMAKGRRDLMSGEGEDFVDGVALGAKANWKLPARWNLTGDWTQSQLSDQEDAAESWAVKMDGPVVHPWGEAKATASFNATDTGFATLNSPTESTGNREGRVSLQQEVAMGRLSGKMRVAAHRRRRPGASSLTEGTEAGQQNLEGGANFRLNLSPKLALVGSGTVSARAREIIVTKPEETAPPEVPSTPDETEVPAEAPVETDETPVETVDSGGITAARDALYGSSFEEAFARPSLSNARADLTEVAGGDVGLEMRINQRLALTVSAGHTRTADTRFLDGAREALGKRGENRVGIELRNRWGEGSWGIKVSRKMWEDYWGMNNDLADDGTVFRVDAERKLFGDFRLRGTVDWSRQDCNLGMLSARRAEAQLTMANLGRLDMSYSDGPLSTFNLIPNPSASEAREIGVRYNVGSAAGGDGFGLALEYARRTTSSSDPEQNWRVGVTYR